MKEYKSYLRLPTEVEGFDFIYLFTNGGCPVNESNSFKIAELFDEKKIEHLIKCFPSQYHEPEFGGPNTTNIASTVLKQVYGGLLALVMDEMGPLAGNKFYDLNCVLTPTEKG